MEKIPRGKFFKYPISRLFKEDIISLYELLNKNCDKVDLVINNYKLEITELDTLEIKKSSNFSIKCRNPFITFEGRSFQLELYLSDYEDTLQRGIKTGIDDLLNQRRSILSYFDFGENIYATIGLILISVIIGSIFPFNVYIGVILAIFLGCFFIYMYNISLNNHVIIYLNKSKHDLTFLERNRDALIVTFFSTLFASILAYFIYNLIIRFI